MLHRTSLSVAPIVSSLVWLALVVTMAALAFVAGSVLLTLVLALLAAPIVIHLLVFLMRYATTEFVVTTRRIIIKTGVLATSTSEMNIAKVESVSVNRGIIGSMFGYGDLTITGSGGSHGRLTKVAGPDAFKRAILQRIGEMEHVATPSTAPPATTLTADARTRFTVRQPDGSVRSYTLNSTEPAKVAQAVAKLASQGMTLVDTQQV